MNIKTLEADRNYIKANVGQLSVEQMILYYERYMNGADCYLEGVEHDGKVYGIFEDSLNPEFCSCQTDHKANAQYLRFRPHQTGAKKIANHSKAIYFGEVEEVYSLYKCNNKQGFNSGYCFEIAVCNKYQKEWKQDNKSCTKGGDVCIDGKEVQLKFAQKESLATITSTAKILRQIDKLIKKNS